MKPRCYHRYVAGELLLKPSCPMRLPRMLYFYTESWYILVPSSFEVSGLFTPLGCSEL